MRHLALCTLVLAACSSAPVAFPTAPLAADEEAGGRVEATTSGFLLLSLIPIGQNTRFERAVEQLKQKAGADRITDVVVRESWYWCGVGELFVFTVEGTAVRKKR
jgi:hypothetical protein